MSRLELRTRSDAFDDVVASFQDPTRCDGTGLSKLDTAMGGGLFAGKAYGIQARKKIGKTVLLGSISYALNDAGVPHLWIAAEMNDRELETRHLAHALGRPAIDFMDGREDLSELVSMHACDAPDNITYCNAAGVTLPELENVIERAVEKTGIHGVIVDYLQLVRSTGNSNRTEHLETVAMFLANVAREKQIWVLCAAQLNQEDNTRGGEGMLLAFDMVFTLRRKKYGEWAWLEMMETRYTPYMHVGSAKDPGLFMEALGPYFRETKDSD